MLLGSEDCDNRWLYQKYLPRGKVVAVFVVYDDPEVNDKNIFQWPLGVAT